MKLRFLCEQTEQQQKNALYNQNQEVVGSQLKTLNGSLVKRYKNNVGKYIGNQVYAHKDYLYDTVSKDVADKALSLLSETHPNYEWNCFRYDIKSGDIAFQESPDFDSAREPVVGLNVTVTRDGRVAGGNKSFPQIWHHKWLWVKNDYKGFDVAESWEWSKEWLSKLPVPANGSNEANWEKQLKQYDIEE